LDEREPVGELGDVVERARDQVVDRDDLVAGVEQLAAQVRAEEARATRDDDPPVVGGHRPTPRYSNPRRLSLAGSSRLRPSTTRGALSAAATLSKSSQRKSSHSVSTTSAAAPSHVAYGSAHTSTPSGPPCGRDFT